MTHLTDRQHGASDEQREFRGTLRRFLAAEAPSAHVRKWSENDEGYDRELWRGMCQTLGLPGIAIEAAFGGQGFGWSEAALVTEELGRALTPSPFFSSAVLSAGALSAAPAGQHRDGLLQSIAGGGTCSLAISEPRLPFGSNEFATKLSETSDGVSISGVKNQVLDGHTADQLLVTARAADGRVTLVSVDPRGPGVERRRVRTFDATRRFAVIEFKGSPANVLDADAASGLLRSRATATALLCSDTVGGFSAVIDMSVAYARERMQFGRAIGSFQAIKHKLADLWILFEASRAATDEAVAAVAGDREDAVLLSSIAKSYASDAYKRAAFDNIQVHGGIGFTWEVDAHLFLRRAQFNAAFLGPPARHREQITRILEASGS